MKNIAELHALKTRLIWKWKDEKNKKIKDEWFDIIKTLENDIISYQDKVINDADKRIKELSEVIENLDYRKIEKVHERMAKNA